MFNEMYSEPVLKLHRRIWFIYGYSFTHTHDAIILQAVKLHWTGFVTGTDAGTDKSIKFFIKFLYIYFIDEEIHVLLIDCLLW